MVCTNALGTELRKDFLIDGLYRYDVDPIIYRIYLPLGDASYHAFAMILGMVYKYLQSGLMIDKQLPIWHIMHILMPRFLVSPCITPVQESLPQRYISEQIAPSPTFLEDTLLPICATFSTAAPAGATFSSVDHSVLRAPTT